MSPKRKRLLAKTAKGHLYFAISEVSNLLHVSPSTLRMWENMGLILPDRTSGGRRVYSPEKVERLKYIQRLRTEKKLNVEAIRQVLGTTETLDRGRSNAPATSPSISRELRRLRRQRRMTLSEAASGTNLSVSFLSSLERGHVNASVATLQKLAVFYKTNVQSFFGVSKKHHKLVTPRIRRQLSNEPGVNIELLAFGNNAMEPHLYRIAPGATSGGAYHHEGEEFIYIIAGSCEIWLDELEHYLLQKGDCLYFSSTQTHRWHNSGNETAVLLWTNTPPTF
jgi:DNA-binding transcriptional MerR regulator/quercetin dioxygenase-like cupin family protein